MFRRVVWSMLQYTGLIFDKITTFYVQSNTAPNVVTPWIAAGNQWSLVVLGCRIMTLMGITLISKHFTLSSYFHDTRIGPPHQLPARQYNRAFSSGACVDGDKMELLLRRLDSINQIKWAIWMINHSHGNWFVGRAYSLSKRDSYKAMGGTTTGARVCLSSRFESSDMNIDWRQSKFWSIINLWTKWNGFHN